MDSRLHKIFYEKYEDLQVGPTFSIRNFLRRVPPHLFRAIETASSNVKDRRGLRADARLFLAINFHQMVIEPLQEAQSIPQDELLDLVYHDVDTIVQEAANEGSQHESREIAATPSEDGISSGAVLRALARKWKDLELNRLGTWGS
jgi:hypothetical protein